MNPNSNNAFSDGDYNQASPAAFGGGTGWGAPHSAKGLASSLSPMQARLSEAPFGWSLQLSPMRAFDALRVLSRIASGVTSTEGDEPVSLLFDVAPASGSRSGAGDDQPALTNGALGQTAERLGIATLDFFANPLGDQLVMHTPAQQELIAMMATSRVRSVLVEGPIEQGDGRAIMQAVAAGQSPLDVEFRALASITITSDRVVALHCRDKDHAAMLVAENFRHYLAALRRRPAAEFAVPAPSQVRRLLEVSGTLTVRPIETEVFSTSIDVGVNTDGDGRSIPADQSLIYDVPSDSWHDEP